MLSWIMRETWSEYHGINIDENEAYTDFGVHMKQYTIEVVNFISFITLMDGGA